MRLVVHGGNTHTYDGVKYDPLGWNLPYSNSHGYARTRYIFGLSDHIAQTYNTTTTPGTVVLSLLLGGDTAQPFEYIDGVLNIDNTRISTAQKRVASDHLKNDFVCVEEGCIVLPLGLVQAI